MNFQLKSHTPEEKAIIEKLTAFLLKNSNRGIDVKEYGPFTSFDIDSSYGWNIGVIFSENLYLSNQYSLMFFLRENHETQIFIPVNFIDTIYSF